MSGLVTTGTVNIVGTGGILEGDLDDANVNVNLDKSLIFDGTNDYINCGTDTDHDFTDHFTLACWAKNDNATTTGGDREHLIAKYAGSNDHRLFRLYLHGSTLRFGCGYNSGNSSIEITHSMTGLMDHWNHYAATFDGGVMKLYVNGVLVTNTDNSGTLTAIHSKNTRALNLGAYEDGGHTWTGQMADVRIYNAVVDQPDIQLLASKINTDSSLGVGTTNLKGYWKLNGEAASGGAIGSGTGFVPDESGTVNQGTLTNFSGTYWDYDAYSVDVYDNSTTTDGNFTVTQGKVECLSLTSGRYAGSDGVINCGSPTTLDNTFATDASWAAWIKADNDGENDEGRIVSKNQWILHVEDESSSTMKLGFDSAFSSTNGKWNSTNRDITVGKWHHVAVVYNASSVSNDPVLYIDGIAVAVTESQTPVGSVDADASSDLIIGNDINGTRTFHGNIKDVRYYDYELTAEQVASLYSNTLLQTPNHYWRINEGTGTAIEDEGTETDADGTAADSFTWTNGTLDLDNESSILTIGTDGDSVVKGTFSAPRGTLLTQQDFKNFGSYIHNNGTIEFDGNGSTDINEDSNCVDTTFYNVKHSSPSDDELTFRMYTNFTIEGTLTNAGTDGDIRFATYSADKTVTFGTSTTAGAIVNSSANTSKIEFSGNTTYQTTLQAANSLYPFTVTGTDFDWDSGGSGSKVSLSGVNYDPDITTGGSGVTITLTGDCEFDAVTLSSGDTLDINGQRVEFGGDVTYQGTIDADGLLVFNGGFTKYGTLNNAASGDIMTMGTSGHPTFSYITGYRTFFANGGVQLGTGGFTNVSKAIVASGELRTGTRDTSCSDFTIARGGTFDADDNTHTVSGNFRNGGGLYGDNCLELDESANEYAYNAGTTWGIHDAYTIELWFKTSESGTNYLFDYYNGTNDNNRIRAYTDNNNDVKVECHNSSGSSSGTELTTSANPNVTQHDGKWHHFALTNSGTEIKLYYDGKLSGQLTATCDRDNDPTMRLLIGKVNGSTAFNWDGNISDFRMFSDVRTEAEIRADMFNGDFVPITKTAAYNNDPTITLSSAAYDIVVGMSVSGTGIPAGAYVASITSSTVFELSASTTGGSLSGQTLTFTGLKDRGNLVASYPFTEGSGSAVDNVETTSARDLVLYNDSGVEASDLWVPIGTGGVFTRDGSTVSITGKTSKVTVAHNTTFHGLSVAASGGSTWVTSPQGAGYDFYIAGPFTCNGGVLQPNSGSRFDFANNGYDIVYNGTDLGTTSVLTMNSSGTVFFPYKDGTSTAQNYGGFSIRGPAALSGDAVINGSFDFGGSNETFNTRGFDISLNSSSSLINSGHTFIADAGTTITMGHSNGWVNSAGTMKLWGENAAVFPEPQNNTLTRANAAALQFGTGDFSISFWYKSDDSWDREHQILGNANFYLHLNNAGASAEKLRAYMGDAYVDTGAFNSARLGQNWNHFVVTFDRSDLLKVYVNGSYEANVDISGKSGQDIMNSGTLTIGETNATSGRGWHGSLADMRFFKGTVLTDGGVSVGQAATGNVASLYNSGLNPATHISSDGDGGYYASDSPTATTWWKLGNTNASGARTTAPALDLTDSSSGSLTLTNTGGVKAGSIFMTKSSGSYSITDSNDTLIMYWRNCKINMNGNTELYVSSASQFSGRITLD